MPSVIITGADRGLGFSLCKEFLTSGWTVFGTKFLSDYSLLEQEQEKNANLHIVPLDLCKTESIVKMRDTVSEKTDSLDMLISNAAFFYGEKMSESEKHEKSCSIDELPLDLDAPWNSFRINALGPILVTEYLLPLLDNGKLKRLCYVSSEVASITLMKHRIGNSYPYPMSKSSLNMGVRLLHNLLFPQGYTFRLYHPGWMKRQQVDGSLSEWAQMNPDDIAAHCSLYFEKPLGDEHRLVMYDYLNQEWPF